MKDTFNTIGTALLAAGAVVGGAVVIVGIFLFALMFWPLVGAFLGALFGWLFPATATTFLTAIGLGTLEFWQFGAILGLISIFFKRGSKGSK